jgi:hypothetical protein
MMSALLESLPSVYDIASYLWTFPGIFTMLCTYTAGKITYGAAKIWYLTPKTQLSQIIHIEDIEDIELDTFSNKILQKS